MIAVVDYGMGNLRSVQKAIEKVGTRAAITQAPEELLKAEKVVLPGVGAMRPAMDKLAALGLVEALRNFVQSGKPFLGICLGFQLLFEKSYEGGEVKGLGFQKGSVERFLDLKVPHMGWNQLKIAKPECPLFKGVKDLAEVYFCHSYFVKPNDRSLIATTTEYGIEFASSIAKDNIFGVQFHPEKSQGIGLNILQNFAKL